MIQNFYDNVLQIEHMSHSEDTLETTHRIIYVTPYKFHHFIILIFHQLLKLRRDIITIRTETLDVTSIVFI